MSTKSIWQNHFGDSDTVGIFHENIESFFNDLNAECICEDIEAKRSWHYPTLRHVDNQWRIYSDSGAVFVLLDKAIPELLDACLGARERLEIENNKPF